MNVKMYLYPTYVSLKSASNFSPNLFFFLENQGVKLEAEFWGGILDTIPTGEPVIIRASTMMKCSLFALAKRCEQLGHFLYYNDCLVLPDGDLASNGLLEAANRFLDKVKSRQMKDSAICQKCGASICVPKEKCE